MICNGNLSSTIDVSVVINYRTSVNHLVIPFKWHNGNYMLQLPDLGDNYKFRNFMNL
jgi:hypothetical protein